MSTITYRLQITLDSSYAGASYPEIGLVGGVLTWATAAPATGTYGFISHETIGDIQYQIDITQGGRYAGEDVIFDIGFADSLGVTVALASVPASLLGGEVELYSLISGVETLIFKGKVQEVHGSDTLGKLILTTNYQQFDSNLGTTNISFLNDPSASEAKSIPVVLGTIPTPLTVLTGSEKAPVTFERYSLLPLPTEENAELRSAKQPGNSAVIYAPLVKIEPSIRLGYTYIGIHHSLPTGVLPAVKNGFLRITSGKAAGKMYSISELGAIDIKDDGSLLGTYYIRIEIVGTVDADDLATTGTYSGSGDGFRPLKAIANPADHGVTLAQWEIDSKVAYADGQAVNEISFCSIYSEEYTVYASSRPLVGISTGAKIVSPINAIEAYSVAGSDPEMVGTSVASAIPGFVEYTSVPIFKNAGVRISDESSGAYIASVTPAPLRSYYGSQAWLNFAGEVEIANPPVLYTDFSWGGFGTREVFVEKTFTTTGISIVSGGGQYYLPAEDLRASSLDSSQRLAINFLPVLYAKASGGSPIFTRAITVKLRVAVVGNSRHVIYTKDYVVEAAGELLGDLDSWIFTWSSLQEQMLRDSELRSSALLATEGLIVDFMCTGLFTNPTAGTYTGALSTYRGTHSSATSLPAWVEDGRFQHGLYKEVSVKNLGVLYHCGDSINYKKALLSRNGNSPLRSEFEGSVLNCYGCKIESGGKHSTALDSLAKGERLAIYHGVGGEINSAVLYTGDSYHWHLQHLGEKHVFLNSNMIRNSFSIERLGDNCVWTSAKFTASYPILGECSIEIKGIQNQQSSVDFGFKVVSTVPNPVAINIVRKATTSVLNLQVYYDIATGYEMPQIAWKLLCVRWAGGVIIVSTAHPVKKGLFWEVPCVVIHHTGLPAADTPVAVAQLDVLDGGTGDFENLNIRPLNTGSQDIIDTLDLLGKYAELKAIAASAYARVGREVQASSEYTDLKWVDWDAYLPHIDQLSRIMLWNSFHKNILRFRVPLEDGLGYSLLDTAEIHCGIYAGHPIKAYICGVKYIAAEGVAEITALTVQPDSDVLILDENHPNNPAALIVDEQYPSTNFYDEAVQ